MLLPGSWGAVQGFRYLTQAVLHHYTAVLARTMPFYLSLESLPSTKLLVSTLVLLYIIPLGGRWALGKSFSCYLHFPDFT